MDWKRKLSSRKFWTAVADFAAMLIVALGGTHDLAVQITALILAGAGVVAYIVAEGLADAANTVQSVPESTAPPDKDDFPVEKTIGYR